MQTLGSVTATEGFSRVYGFSINPCFIRRYLHKTVTQPPLQFHTP